MSENSKIEWCDHTFNPWIGCARVSPGCDHCYAAVSTPARAMHVSWGANEPRHRTAPSTWKDPIKWNGKHEAFFAAHGRRQRVFCASLADVFDNAVDPTWRVDLFRLIEATPKLDWLLLTKRIGNVRSMSQVAMGAIGCIHKPLPENVWLGVTVVNQEEADRDIPKLLAVPARVRFLSMEPLLAPVNLTPFFWQDMNGNVVSQRYREKSIDWVIAGGESGAGARPMHPAWARSLREQCAAAGVPFLFKQWGEWAPQLGAIDLYEFGEVSRRQWVAWDGGRWDYWDRPAWCDDIGAPEDCLVKVGKKTAGRLLDGRAHDEYPEGA